jgi:hypothetical protein
MYGYLGWWDSHWVPLPVTAFCAIRSSSRNYVDRSVSIKFTHPGAFVFSVTFTGLDNTQGVNP